MEGKGDEKERRGEPNTMYIHAFESSDNLVIFPHCLYVVEDLVHQARSARRQWLPKI